MQVAALGFHGAPVDAAMARTVEGSLASDPDGSYFDPCREAEEQLLEAVE